jgi:hypothetical protein
VKFKIKLEFEVKKKTQKIKRKRKEKEKRNQPLEPPSLGPAPSLSLLSFGPPLNQAPAHAPCFTDYWGPHFSLLPTSHREPFLYRVGPIHQLLLP